MTTKVSKATIKRGVPTLTETSEHEHQADAVEVAYGIVQGDAAPKGAVVAVQFMRPFGILVANGADQALPYAFIEGASKSEIDRLIAVREGKKMVH